MKREKIEKTFVCQTCEKEFIRLVPKKGKKPFYMFCSDLCNSNYGAKREENKNFVARKHRYLKRMARCATFKQGRP